MTSIFQYNGKWAVSYRLPGEARYRQKRGLTREDAERFVSAGGFAPDGRKGGLGRRRRSEAEVVDHIASQSALTDSGCMEWQGYVNPEGYGVLNWKQLDGYVMHGAHRVAYHVLVAPVVRDLVIDHLCRNRSCVRPDHLDLVKQRENVMRSPIAPGALNAAKTHCPHGHEYSPENTYVYTFKTRKTTTRICRTCQHNQYLRRRALRMGAVA